MIIYKKGDLFTSNAPALAHGCNTTGKMGAGIAKVFKQRYIEMYKEYKRLCGEGKFILGQGYIFTSSDGKHVFNLATQDSLSGATPESIELAFHWMKKQMEILEVKHLAMPKIGCGLGGLNWETDVLPILNDLFIDKQYILEIWVKNEG